MLGIIGAILALFGSIFLLIASLGLVRMPDVYNRMQAGTKATTLGSMLVFVGFVFVAPASWVKLLLLLLFVFLTNPLSSHALARSSHARGIPALIPGKSDRAGGGRDDLETWKTERGESDEEGGAS